MTNLENFDLPKESERDPDDLASSQGLDLLVVEAGKKANGSERYRLLEKLPRKVRYLRSLRATDTRMGREVEVRLLRRGTPKALEALFYRERKGLLLLDHQAFLPVLDDTTIKGRPCYVVPLRSFQDLMKLVETGGLPLAERCSIVRQLAGAQAAAHRTGKLLGAVRPEMICWDRQTGSVHYAHHVCRDPNWPVVGANEAVIGEELESPREPGSDIFLWGVQAYWILSLGETPFDSRGHPGKPIGELIPELDSTLAYLVDSCLSEYPADRPENGLELHQLLQVHGANLREPEEEHRPSPEESIHGSLAEIRSSNLKMGDAYLPSDRQVALEPLSIDAVLADEDMSGLVLTPRVLVVFVVALLLSAAFVVMRLSNRRSGGEVHRMVVLEATGPSPGLPKEEVDWLIEPLPASAQAPFLRDRGIRRLLDKKVQTLGNFHDLWKLTRKLCLRRRLPKPLNGWGRVQKIQERFKASPEDGVKALEEYRKDLRIIVGMPKATDSGN
jgi:hypothetical protein